MSHGQAVRIVPASTLPRPLALALAAVLAATPCGIRAEEAVDPHAHCKELAEAAAMKRATVTSVDSQVPRVTLVRDDGQQVSLPDELDDGRPVVLDFVYTSCTTICPVLSGTFTRLQARLDEAGVKYHLVSISIDPEQDTPARLVEYARRFHAGPQWRHYTGTVEASVEVQRAFAAYRGDKMNHTPVTFLRAAPGQRWVRVDGFATADELAGELRALVATR
jgi:protein SCO1/2